ncbi:hypothetical protein ACFWNH_29615 [Rhodococcus qingshengii]|uniref:hypothetical protein n=1 Tax=Rhodococcus qingshengii TaxID=334542 RepID=UPI00366A4FCF
MRNSPTRGRSRLLLVVAVVVIVVAGSLWWTKTIAFTRTAVVAFGVEPANDGVASFALFDVETSPADLTTTAELLAQTRGGHVSDYESDLTISSATDVAGLAVTARGRTPATARSLATDAAEVLSSYLADRSATNPKHFTYTVVPAR